MGYLSLMISLLVFSLDKQQQSEASKHISHMSGAKALYRVSAGFQKLVGQSELTRSAAVKEFWAYAKKHQLQDPSDGRIIRPNAEMKELLSVDKDMIKFTEVMGLVSRHLKDRVGA
ncbi:hypothetical protein PINS_up011910 [Pythium insidiosum]|nr:hypothetical protein PINS_up011910 [Pythium insidiosum]